MKPLHPLRFGIIFLTITLFSSLSAQIQTIEWQGMQREYLVRTPSTPTANMPVMFFLHGLNNLVGHLDQQYNFAQLAEDYGWMIVLPQALDLGIGTMWNVGFTDSPVDDVGFLTALLDTLTDRYQLNTDSVFFTGYSMGGFMSHRMAIEQGDRITACAPVSGLITNALASQTPVSPVRILLIHGTNDDIVGYDGYSFFFGMEIGLRLDSIINYWTTYNGCEGEPHIDTLPDLKDDGLRFVRYTYDCSTDVQHLKVIGGAHIWYHNPNLYDVGYMDVIHDFFTGHFKPSSIPDMTPTSLKIWPNPSTGLVNLFVNGPTNITITDILGKRVYQQCIPDGTSQINLRELPDGVYFIHGNQKFISKLILNRP